MAKESKCFPAKQTEPLQERANHDLAECFNFYLAEEGFDQVEGLSDDQHKTLIQKQFNEFKAVLRDGFF